MLIKGLILKVLFYRRFKLTGGILNVRTKLCFKMTVFPSNVSANGLERQRSERF